MAQNRISVLVSLDGTDDNLKATLTHAEKSLNDFAGSAKTAGEKATAGLAEVKAGVAAFSDQFNRAKTQLIAFLAAFEFVGKIRDLVEIADAWYMMNARLKLATAGSQEYTNAQKELYAIAQRIGVPLQETATLYGKLQQAVSMLGGEQKDALQITESISQALHISGARVTEAQSALLQFGQALSSGVLRGEEFNSVVENSPRLAQSLADGLNVPIGRLRKKAEEGKLTADVVVNALLGQKEKLAAEYAQLPQTVSQAFERLKNAFGLWVHQLDESTGFTHKLAAALDVLTQHLDTVMKWLNIIKDVGLAVIIYRLLPALATAWQTAGVAAVTAANATATAWTTANLSVGAAVASAGALKVAFGVLTAAFVGWEIGTWLSDKFEIVRKAGVFMVQALMTGIEHPREGYGALFAASAGAIKTLAADEKLLGAEAPGFFGVLHTWGRQLQYHPHIHYVVPGGGFDGDGHWHEADRNFFLPVRALSPIFRAKFRDAIATVGLADEIDAKVWAVDWNVNCQAVGDGGASLEYLSRYVFKVGISEGRIVAADESKVVFKYRKVNSSRERTLTLSPEEFIRRFLQHVLPTGFMKVRYFGFLSPSFSMPIEEVKGRIEMAHGFLVQAAPVAQEMAEPQPRGKGCPHCGGKLRWCSVVLPRPLGSRDLVRAKGADGAPPEMGGVCRSG